MTVGVNSKHLFGPVRFALLPWPNGFLSQTHHMEEQIQPSRIPSGSRAFFSRGPGEQGALLSQDEDRLRQSLAAGADSGQALSR